MSMDACVVGFGKYTKKVVNDLDYPADYYNDVLEGTELVVECLHCGGSSTSVSLAVALGVKPWDFNTHKIDPAKINWDALTEVSERAGWGDSYDRFHRLITRHGFTFFYQPHG